MWKKIDTPVASQPIVSIHNYQSERYESYLTSITFSADVTNAPDGAELLWLYNGEEVGTCEIDETLTVSHSIADCTVQVKLVDSNGNVLAESETETVKVSNGFFSRLIGFIRALFGMLPVKEQAFAEN